jgi:tetratricopeptide (TPR) repeat protein
MTRTLLCRLAFVVALVVALLGGHDGVVAAPTENTDAALREVDVAVSAWNIPAARDSLARARPSVLKDVRTAMVEFFEGDYAEAERLLAGAIASGELAEGSRNARQAAHYLALARGSQRALGNATVITSPDGHVEAIFADAKDTILAPYLFDAMAVAREAVGDVIGVRPDHTVRFEFLDDPAKLAMVSPLTLDAIRTTGTVGLTKYRRITMVTPRVLIYGYPWLDTAIHEYVHYVLALRTANQAPVWLQEGLAKLLETRWRQSDPAKLEPGVASLLHRALTRDELVTLDEMYPSVAMLPTQEKAALAYAETQTMLALLYERGGTEAIAVLLERVSHGEDAKEAFAAAWGTDFDTFFSTWKRTMTRRTAGEKGGELRGPQYKDPGASDDEVDPSLLGDVFSHLGGGRARQHARLGVLLTLRGHKRAASMQYEKARKVDAAARKDPKLSRRLGELYVELEEYRRAVPLLDIAARHDPEHANIAAAQGRARLRSGDRTGARESLERALRNNPFVPTIHCDLAELAKDEKRRRHEQAQCRE